MVRVKNEANINFNINSPYQRINDRNNIIISILIIYFYIIAAFGTGIIFGIDYLSTFLFYNIVILSAIMFAGLAQASNTLLTFELNLGLSFLVLFFVLGFRNYSGIDDASYISIFYEVAREGWFARFQQTTMEPGYLILNNIVSLFTDNYLFLQLTTSFIPLFLFYRGFKKYRNYISLPMAVFLLITMMYFQMLSVALVRMFIAISIVFTAFYYIQQRKPIKYICLIIIASLFHYSAFFMLVLTYFAFNKNDLSKKAKRFVVVGFVATPFVFLAVAKYFVPLLGNRYAGYATVDKLSLSFTSFDTIPLLILLLVFRKKFYNEKAEYFNLFLSIFALSCIISIYSSMISLGRLIFYANPAFFLAAPMVNKILTRNSKRLVFSSIIILYGFIYVYWTQFTLKTHIPNLFPYKNILFTL